MQAKVLHALLLHHRVSESSFNTDIPTVSETDNNALEADISRD
jgi:hypothetical protein